MHPVTVQDWLIVSIGDSVASGEAAPDAADLFEAVWQCVRCHRNARAAPAKAAEHIEAQDDHTSVTFLHPAGSRATIEAGLLGDYDGVLAQPCSRRLPPQINVLNRAATRPQVDAVVVSVGANNVYFGDIVSFSALNPARNCFSEPLTAAGGRTITAAVRTAPRRLPGAHAEIPRRIGRRVPARRVHLVDYFDPTRGATGATCRTLSGFIGPEEVEATQSRVVGPLNKIIAGRRRNLRWSVVKGVAPLFRTHGCCAGRQSSVTALSGSITRLGGELRGRHLGTLQPERGGTRRDRRRDRTISSTSPTISPPRCPRVPSKHPAWWSYLARCGPWRP